MANPVVFGREIPPVERSLGEFESWCLNLEAERIYVWKLTPDVVRAAAALGPFRASWGRGASFSHVLVSGHSMEEVASKLEIEVRSTADRLNTLIGG